MISEEQKVCDELVSADLTTEAGRAKFADATAKLIELQVKTDKALHSAVVDQPPVPAFYKTIEQRQTGTVQATVQDSAGNVVGWEWFDWPIWNQERRLQRAHAWADRWIANCQKYVTDERGRRGCRELEG